MGLFRKNKGEPEEEQSQPQPQPQGWSALRNDLMPQMDQPHIGEIASDYDAGGAARRRKLIKTGLTLVILLALAGVGWYLFLGPGKSLVKTAYNALSNLNAPIAMATPLATVTTTITPTATRTLTPTPTDTPEPTRTPVESFPDLATPTSEITATIGITPTLGPTDCVPALQVTLEDVGKTLCVTGEVLRVSPQGGENYFIVISDEKGSFYFISYGIKWPAAVPGACVMATGEIKQLSSSPVMVLSFKSPLVACP